MSLCSLLRYQQENDSHLTFRLLHLNLHSRGIKEYGIIFIAVMKNHHYNAKQALQNNLAEKEFE